MKVNLKHNTPKSLFIQFNNKSYVICYIFIHNILSKLLGIQKLKVINSSTVKSMGKTYKVYIVLVSLFIFAGSFYEGDSVNSVQAQSLSTCLIITYMLNYWVTVIFCLLVLKKSGFENINSYKKAFYTLENIEKKICPNKINSIQFKIGLILIYIFYPILKFLFLLSDFEMFEVNFSVAIGYLAAAIMELEVINMAVFICLTTNFFRVLIHHIKIVFLRDDEKTNSSILMSIWDWNYNDCPLFKKNVKSKRDFLLELLSIYDQLMDVINNSNDYFGLAVIL